MWSNWHGPDWKVKGHSGHNTDGQIWDWFYTGIHEFLKINVSWWNAGEIWIKHHNLKLQGQLDISMDRQSYEFMDGQSYEFMDEWTCI